MQNAMYAVNLTSRTVGVASARMSLGADTKSTITRRGEGVVVMVFVRRQGPCDELRTCIETAVNEHVVRKSEAALF